MTTTMVGGAGVAEGMAGALEALGSPVVDAEIEALRASEGEPDVVDVTTGV